MSLLNRGRKLFYLAGVALLGGRVVIRVISVTQKSHLPYRKIEKLKMATTMLDHVDHFFGLPTGIFWIDCFIAELGAREAEGLGAGLK